MMFFDYFGVESVAESFSGFFHEVEKKIYAHAHIARAKNRHLFGQRGDCGKLLVVIARAGNDGRFIVLFAQRDNARQKLGAREIDYHVEIARHRRYIVISRNARVGHAVKAAHNLEFVGFFGLLAHEPAHFSVNSE